tara:strand:- start:1098 stop:1235 length:138 start_codon:yes stop_codon:yes gene_type:complete
MAIKLKLINTQTGEVVLDETVANKTAANNKLKDLNESVQVIWEEE